MVDEAELDDEALDMDEVVKERLSAGANDALKLLPALGKCAATM